MVRSEFFIVEDDRYVVLGQLYIQLHPFDAAIGGGSPDAGRVFSRVGLAPRWPMTLGISGQQPLTVLFVDSRRVRNFVAFLTGQV